MILCKVILLFWYGPQNIVGVKESHWTWLLFVSILRSTPKDKPLKYTTPFKISKWIRPAHLRVWDWKVCHINIKLKLNVNVTHVSCNWATTVMHILGYTYSCDALRVCDNIIQLESFVLLLKMGFEIQEGMYSRHEHLDHIHLTHEYRDQTHWTQIISYMGQTNGTVTHTKSTFKLKILKKTPKHEILLVKSKILNPRSFHWDLRVRHEIMKWW